MKFRENPLYHPSGLNSSFSFSGDSFADYINHTRSIIKKARIDLQDSDNSAIIEKNSPFELKPVKPNGDGILLIHGLYDSPYAVKDMAKHFQDRGYLVRAILLPGHGTVPGDLLDVSYHEWLKAVEFGVSSFKDDAETLIVGGFSTGALLAQFHSLGRDDISAILAFAPPLRIKSRYAFMTTWHKVISWAIPQAKWLYLGEDADPAKYESLTFNSAHQVYELGKVFNQKNKKHNYSTPTFFALSTDDELVRTDIIINYFRSLSNTCNRLIIYTTENMEYDDSRIKVINSNKPDENILNFSHACLTISPDNPHYGRHGDYKDFRHYRNWALNKYQAVLNQEIYQGALTVKNLEHYHLQKLSYNPYYDDLMEDIDKFIGSL